MRDSDPQTIESIARSKAAQLAERAEIERKTGLRIADDGSITVPPRAGR